MITREHRIIYECDPYTLVSFYNDETQMFFELESVDKESEEILIRGWMTHFLDTDTYTVDFSSDITNEFKLFSFKSFDLIAAGADKFEVHGVVSPEQKKYDEVMINHLKLYLEKLLSRRNELDEEVKRVENILLYQ